MLHKPLISSKLLAIVTFIPVLTACKVTTDDQGVIYGQQDHGPVESCLRNLKWQRQQNVIDVVDKDASEGDRLVSAIILSNTNEAEERLKCESLSRPYKLEAVPEKPKSKTQEQASS